MLVRPMLLHRMALVSVRLFCKNLGNLQEFFGQMVYRPPWQKIARTPMSIRKLPKEPLSIYGGEETMHLLMMTYRQDIAGVIHGRSFPKYTQAHLSTEVFMLKNNFTTLSFKSNTKFSVILIVRITN